PGSDPRGSETPLGAARIQRRGRAAVKTLGPDGSDPDSIAVRPIVDRSKPVRTGSAGSPPQAVLMVPGGIALSGTRQLWACPSSGRAGASAGASGPPGPATGPRTRRGFRRRTLEPTEGVEPTTGGLQNRCSTVELRR